MVTIIFITNFWLKKGISLSQLTLEERCIEEQNLKTKLLLQVHDELVLEVPENELDLVQKQVNHLMVCVAKLRVPLEVGIGIGDNWEEAH